MLLQRLDITQFNKVFSIMEASFPLEEYRPYEEQKALLEDPAYAIYVHTDEKIGKVNAFLSVWDFETMGFIEHFAVDPACRGGGLGGKLLDEITSLFEKPVCLEVEPPENEITTRRVGFYSRHGFFLNSYPYMQPSISKGRSPLPLLIMTSGRTIEKTEFEAVKTLLYRRVYKVL